MPLSFNDIKRQSHNKRTSMKSVRRMAFFAIIVLGLVLLMVYQFDKAVQTHTPQSSTQSGAGYQPEVVKGIVYRKPHFALSYVEQFELPEWVSYTLTSDMLHKPKIERTQDFEPDPVITTGSGHYRDYKDSGYRRGHLVPSADMAWNKEAMDATFLMSNIAPMTQMYNDGIWLELEQNVRDWARRYERIEVVTGPVFGNDMLTVGQNEIAVPKFFYKTIFTVPDSVPMVIGFLIPQSNQAYEDLSSYVVSIDSIEALTGIDLYSNLYGDWEAEISAEKNDLYDPQFWGLNPVWKKQRVETEARIARENLSR